MTANPPATPPATPSAYLVLTADINETTCQPIINAINTLVHQGHNEVHILMASTGGSVMHGFALYNTITAMPIHVITYNIANIDSIANVVFLAGDHRVAAPNATFMFHGVWRGMPGPTLTGPQAKEAAHFIDVDEQRIANVLSSRTKLDTGEIASFFEGGVTKDAPFALGAEIVHAVEPISIPPGSIVQPLMI